MDLQFILSVSTCMVESLFFSGIILGWPSLQYVLQNEGYFQDLCVTDDVFDNVSKANVTNATELRNCPERESSFNLVFTLAVSLMFFLSLPIGFIFDRFETWVCRTILTSIFTVGYILLTVSSPSSSNLLYPAMIFIAVSGLGLLSTNVQIANLSKSYKGLIITFMNGLFDSAAIIFFLIKIGYYNGTKLTTMFHILAWCSIFPWMRTFILMPRRRIPCPLPEQPLRYGWKEWICFKRSVEINVNDEGNVSDPVELPQSSQSDTDIKESLSGKSVIIRNDKSESFASCLCTVIFWTNLFHFVVLSFRVTFYLGTFQVWVGSFEDASNISGLTNVLGILLLLAGVEAPLNGILIDGVVKYYKSKNKGADERNIILRGVCISMLVTSFLGIILAITVVIPNSYASAIFLNFLRAFIYSGNATFIAIAFPSQHFGKLFGITNAINGLISLLQFALFQLALAADPTFKYINIGLLVLTVLTLVHPLALYRHIQVGAKTKKSNIKL